jgi:hypothetical protein
VAVIIAIEGLYLGFVANHFDVVSVGTNDESCIVVRVVVRAQTRRTIVFATRRQSRAIESFDLLAIPGAGSVRRLSRVCVVTRGTASVNDNTMGLDK